MNKHNMPTPATYVLGKPTFWGCYLMYRDQIALDRGWNPETRKGYESTLLNKIVPNIPGHNQKSLSSLTWADFSIALKQVHLHLATREPAEQLRITIHADIHNPVKVHTTSYLVKPGAYNTELNVIKDLHQLYKKELSDTPYENTHK